MEENIGGATVTYVSFKAVCSLPRTFMGYVMRDGGIKMTRILAYISVACMLIPNTCQLS